MRWKNFILTMGACVIMFAFSGAAAHAGGVSVKIGGEVQSFSQPPRIINDRVMVPVRGVFDSLGATLFWNPESKTARAVSQEVSIKLQPGVETARVNSKNYKLSQPPLIIEGRTLVPLRFVSESLGAGVRWESSTRTVHITPQPREQNPVVDTEILGSTGVSVKQAQAWARSRGATGEFVALAPLYWELAPECGGVNPAGAYVQAAKETGFGNFGGVVEESFKNPCGMKTHEGGANSDPDAHQRFASWEEGVRAHLDHLALYAGAPGYPKENTPDPRHFEVIKGRARTFEGLGGNWAPSPEYGKSIVNGYLEPLVKYEA